MKSYTTSLLLSVLISLALFQVSNAQTATIDWVQKIGAYNTFEPGDYGYSRGYDLAVDNEGNIYTTGVFLDTLDFDPDSTVYSLYPTGWNTQGVFISKIDSNGALLWARSFNGSKEASGYSIVVDDFGNVYTAGYFSDTLDIDTGEFIEKIIADGVYDIFISKIDKNGNFVWIKQVQANEVDKGLALKIDDNNDLYLGGTFSDTIDFNIGAIGQHISNGNTDIFLSKMDPNGHFYWIKQLGGSSQDMLKSIAIDDNSNIYGMGTFKDTVDFDLGNGTYELIFNVSNIFRFKFNTHGEFIWARVEEEEFPSQPVDLAVDGAGNMYATYYRSYFAMRLDLVVKKFDTYGELVWIKLLGRNSSFIFPCSITVDHHGNVYTMGWFISSADFDPDTSIYNMEGYLHGSVFMNRLNADGSFAWAKHNAGLFGLSWQSVDGIHNGTMELDNNGNLYAVGWFDGTGTFDYQGENPVSFTSDPYWPTSKVFNLRIKQEGWANGNIGIDENLIESLFIVFPNPASSHINIHIKNMEDGTISILEVGGKVLQSVSLHPNKTEYTLNIEGYAKGIYFLNIQMEGEKIMVEKLIVR